MKTNSHSKSDLRITAMAGVAFVVIAVLAFLLITLLDSI
jgi:hypothetical protein